MSIRNELRSVLAPQVSEALNLLGSVPGQFASISRLKDLDATVLNAIKICQDIEEPTTGPVRTLHNLSCTGGTLFSKCLASMSNTLVLNEVHLRSRMQFDPSKRSRFTPTDMVSLLRQADASISEELIDDLFVENVRIILKSCRDQGRKVILRDHSHSQFLFGDYQAEAPTLRDTLVQKFDMLSLVTVRNKEDAFASMQRQGWDKMFSPSTFDEYSRRVDLFLERHKGVPVVRYEDFVDSPKAVMNEICDILNLDMYVDFEEVFSSFKFSGDSGRSGNVIARRPPRVSNAK